MRQLNPVGNEALLKVLGKYNAKASFPMTAIQVAMCNGLKLHLPLKDEKCMPHVEKWRRYTPEAADML